METLQQRFNGFWPLFISTHLSPKNRWFHACGNLVMFCSFVAFAATGRWIFLALGFAGYIPSWIGHLVCEGNVPVTLKSPYLSALSDMKMIGLMLAGELEPELIRLFGTPNPKPGALILVSPDEEREYQAQLRYRIRANIPEHPFRDYWSIFLLKHQNPINVWAHTLAMVYLYALLFVVLTSGKWELLIGIPLAQIIGLISHAAVERTHIDFEDALFSPRSFLCLNRMMIYTLTGRYWTELSRVQMELEGFFRETKNSQKVLQ